MAVPRPAPQRRVFRPARRVSWGTRIFAVLVLLALAAAIGGLLEVYIPQQVASLARLEGTELQLAKQGTTDVSASVNRLWSDLSKGTIGLSTQQLTTDQVLAQQVQKSAATTLAHVQAAQAYMAQADGMPFQFHTAAFVASDRPAANHLQNALNAATRLANGANLQIAIALAMNQNGQNLATLNAQLAGQDWQNAARTASALVTSVKLQQSPSNNPDSLLDPLWAHWIDAMTSVVIDSQQYILAAAQNQATLAQQDAGILAAARNQMSAAQSAALANASGWQTKTIQPLLDTLSREAASAAS